MGKEFLILGIVIAIFFISIILNRKVKVPEGTKEVEKCQNCTDFSCRMNQYHPSNDAPIETCEDKENEM